MKRLMGKAFILVVVIWVPFSMKGQTSSPLSSRCTNLTSMILDHAQVTSAAMIPAGASIDGIGLDPARSKSRPAFCRVQVTDRPSSDSDIRTEVWLPAENWNGGYRAKGNGGFAGTIPYQELDSALIEGFVTSGTDTGHRGSSPTFALGHPEKIKDFGWRAVHDMALYGKSIAKSFYGMAPEHSYFTSCSNGGREALMEAQRFPTDFDGILAGDPANDWTSLLAAGTQDEQTLLANDADYIPSTKIPLIAAAVLAACDGQDGLKDGVINDPRLCKFDPAVLSCKDGSVDNCLTHGQIASLNTIYSAKLDSKGKQIFPGYLPGAEDGPGGWTRWILGAAPGKSTFAFFGIGYFSNFIHEQADWSISSFDLNQDLKLAKQKTAADLDAVDPNLKPFADHAGKLIIYHGWNDPAVPALSTVSYYDQVVNALGERATRSAVRLYMVPGMQHCGGGPGANSFGENENEPQTKDPQNIFAALEQWVETGKGPGPLTAKKFVQDDPAKGLGFSRPLCSYPSKIKYVKGDPNNMSSFVCVDHDRLK